MTTSPTIPGILILNKAPGLTSQQALTQLKRHFKIKKLGHTGTLDPLATGVLPVAFGKATKVIPLLDEGTKTYHVQAKLGEATDTLDSDGQVIASVDPTQVSQARLQSALKNFTGAITQHAPLYSAVKVSGKALYRYAHQGKTPEELPKRSATIHKLTLTRWQAPYFELQVQCSRGTYVRSLVDDLAKSLSSLAHVTQLRRDQSGPFTIENALSWETLQEISCLSELATSPAWVSLPGCVSHLPWVEISNPQEKKLLSSGVPITRLQQEILRTYRLDEPIALGYQEELLAVVSLTKEKTLKFLRVFS